MDTGLSQTPTPCVSHITFASRFSSNTPISPTPTCLVLSTSSSLLSDTHFPLSLSRSLLCPNRIALQPTDERRRTNYQLTLDGGFPPPEEKKIKNIQLASFDGWELGGGTKRTNTALSLLYAINEFPLLSSFASVSYRLCWLHFAVARAYAGCGADLRPEGVEDRDGIEGIGARAVRGHSFGCVRACGNQLCVWGLGWSGWSGVEWRGVYSNNIPIKLAGDEGGSWLTVTVLSLLLACLTSPCPPAEWEMLWFGRGGWGRGGQVGSKLAW